MSNAEIGSLLPTSSLNTSPEVTFTLPSPISSLDPEQNHVSPDNAIMSLGLVGASNECVQKILESEVPQMRSVHENLQHRSVSSSEALRKIVQAEDLQHAITIVEMQALLQPLHDSLWRMESKLQERSDKQSYPVDRMDSNSQEPLEKDGHALAGNPSNVAPWSRVGDVQFTTSHTMATATPALTGYSSKYPDAMEMGVRTSSLVDALNGKDTSMNRVINRMWPWFKLWRAIREPDYDNCVSRFVNSNIFEAIVMFAILTYSITVSYSANWQIQHVGQDVPRALDVLETCYFIIFLSELILRLAAHRIYFFLNRDMLWNIFDFVLVTVSLAYVVLEPFQRAGGRNITFMRMLRLFKLARVFRALRPLRFIRSLSQMLDSFHRSFISLFWGFVLLLFVLYLFSLLFVQSLATHIADDTFDAKSREIVDDKFNSLGAAMLALYMSVTGGEDWGVHYNVISKLGPLHAYLFLLFTFFFIFALFNILTGIVVEKAMSENKQHRDQLIWRQRKMLKKQQEQLLDICRTMDTDKNGILSYEEFKQWMDNPAMVAYMASIGLDVEDVHIFFSAVGARRGRSKELDEGEVTFDNFVEGCLHMKGNATAIDMQRALFEIQLLGNDLKHFEGALSQTLGRMEQVLAHGAHSSNVVSAREQVQERSPKADSETLV